jgi:hypothetical protein
MYNIFTPRRNICSVDELANDLDKIFPTGFYCQLHVGFLQIVTDLGVAKIRTLFTGHLERSSRFLMLRKLDLSAAPDLAPTLCIPR